MAVFSSSLDMARLWIIVPTISLYFISSAEAYLWLNPREEEPITGSTAGFRGVLLFLYIWSVVAHALLVFPCSEPGITNAQAFYYWLFGFGTVTFTYSLYNVVWFIKIPLVRFGYVSDDKEGPDFKNAIKYTVYYFGFSLLSVVLGFVVRGRGLFYGAELLTFLLFSLYVVTYFVIWWKVWHRPALSVASEQLF